MNINRLPNTSQPPNTQALTPRYPPINNPIHMGTSGINSNYLSQLIQLIRLLISALQGINPNPPITPETAPALPLNQNQKGNLLELMGYSRNAPFSTTIKDMDKSGSISRGDVAIISGGITGGEIARRTLTASDIQALNKTPTNTGPQNLQANQAKWNSLTSRGNYDFTVINSGFRIDGGRPVNISVRNGAITNATYADTGTAAADYSRVTMNDLFKSIQDAYSGNAERVDVTYDATTGAPLSIYIDESSMIADEETAYTVSNIKILP
ncbi:MAG: DUF6174 domain-containing protein [Thiofilum sp.]|uniref:DUF6174 domain-containing protein n=1 Tax=Thiofilum sp. TaxID=2212733 RepID=UPI00260004C1|nr:DUF6174 domain-containing protein [Thiofilum sp.]MBK8452419.1 hypothetical protein [Thiofilum sp.]